MSVSNHIDQSISSNDGAFRNRRLQSQTGFGYHRVFVASMFAFAALRLMALLPLAQAGDISLSGPIPSTVYEIELTYAGERTDPTVAFNGPPQSPPPLPYRPFVPILELRSGLGEGRVFGPCQGGMAKTDSGIDLHWTGEGAARCGQRLALRRTGKPLDLMSYQQLRISGRTTGQVVVALEDLAGNRRQENVPVGTVTGSFNLLVPLKEIGRRLDLRYVTGMVLYTEAGSARVSLDRMEFVQEPPKERPSVGTGFWVWNYRAAVKDPETMLATCRTQSCSRILIQMPAPSEDEALWREYAGLLSKVQEAGIDVLALDGYPEAIQEPQVLADKIRRLLQLMRPGVLFGVQLDIEPYLVPGFLEDESQLHKYVDTVGILKDAIAGRTRLSMVIPFWLTTPTIHGRPLSYAVMDLADEVAVMSYRTDLDEVQDIAEDILRYGEVSEKPVWLAVETTTLPVEQHVVLRRDSQPGRADALLDRDHRLLRWKPVSEADAVVPHGEWFRIHHRFTVRPESLTFAGRSRAEVSTAIKQMLDSTSHRSFAGVIIHDLDGLRALAE